MRAQNKQISQIFDGIAVRKSKIVQKTAVILKISCKIFDTRSFLADAEKEPAMPEQTAFVTFDNVCKYYQMGDTRIAAADHVCFTIEKGEFCVILGPSGAGKTTVLNMLGGMDTCDEGTILLGRRLRQQIQRPPADRVPPLRRGLCVPVLQPGAEPDRAGKRRAGQRDLPRPAGRRPGAGRGGAFRPEGQFPGPAFGRRAAAGGHRPARWPKTPRSCCATSLPARWTTRPASRCWSFCRTPAGRKAAPSSSSPHNSALAAMADRVIRINSGRVIEIKTNPDPTPVERIEW